ncbi:MAG: PAS domain S-box protein [Thermodesulfobacteriota bacterium]|nr:PAS domain S-box protein [Thermodesulfobacteriota bacterium]
MSKRSILIADDEEAVRSLFAGMLEGEDYRIFVASNGKEAVEMSRANAIDLAILDLMMPEMDGIEALKRIKEIDNTTEVLIMTGYADINDVEKAIIGYEAFDYLLKPFDTRETVRTIERALQKRELFLKDSYAGKELRHRIVELERDFKEKTLQLRKSQVKYENIIEGSDDMIVVIQEGITKYLNLKTLELTGRTKEETLDTPFIAMVHPEDRGIVTEMYDRWPGKARGAPGLCTFRILKKDGTSIWSEAKPVVTEWEGKTALLNIVRDISERKWAEESLRIKDSALASSINGVALADLEGSLTYVNNAFLKLWGYDSAEEVLGKSVQDLWKSREEALGAVRALLESGGWRGEMTAVTRDGALFDLHVSASMVSNAEGKPLCMMASFVDITEKKEMEEAMLRSEKLSSIGQLAAGLAHELRNPLAVISSCAQFCTENMELEPPVNENLEMISRSVQRANKLINDLLAFARPSRLEWKDVDVNDLVTRTWNMAKLEARPFDTKFVLQLEERLPKIVGDEEKLGQVFINLIQNAVQAISGKGRITVRTQVLGPQHQVEVNVIDDGPGVPEDYRYKIFDPFFTTKDTGTGLGLSICHSIIQQHKGSISMECDDVSGTKFCVRLPFKADGKG